jgi:peptidoglycan/LPS O-acetylase OafA/YrhL
MPGKTRDSAHIAALDGLRGLAIILVLLFHFTPESEGRTAVERAMQWISALGWCGVDLFFVLSGFLITGILFDAKGSADYFRNFYMRRVLRIFPLYYGVLLAAFVMVPLIRPMRTEGDAHLVHNQSWLWLYAANIPQAVANGWPLKTGWVNLNHFWSLAVEEHFYLIWPAVVYWFSRKAVMRICGGSMVVALALRCWTYFYWNDTAAYVLTPCRMDELALGALLALAARGPGGMGALVKQARWGAWMLGALLAGIWSLGMEDLNYTVALTVLAAFFGSILLLAVGGGIVARIFETRVLRFFGKYSYGIYVFHWLLSPLFLRVIPAQRVGAAVYMMAAISISVLVAVTSWHLYEKHFLKLKRFFEYEKKKEEELWPSAPVVAATSWTRHC